MSSPPIPLAEDPVAQRAFRKASLRIIPLIAVGYGIAFMDRTNISLAALQMNHDLGFSAAVYGLGYGIFFLPYSLCEVPSNLLLYRFGARRWLARIMITWGFLAALMLLVRTPHQLYAVRFLLGASEAGFFPGIIFYLSQWFPPELRARTVARFYISLPLSQVLIGAVAGPLLSLNGRLGLSGWQWMFLVEALPAILLGIVYLWLLPDTPSTAAWLTSEERAAIAERLDPPGNPDSAESHAGSAVLHAFKDPRVWQFGLFGLLMLGSLYALSSAAPEMIRQATGLAAGPIGYLIAAMNLAGAVAMLVVAGFSDRRGMRYPIVILASLLSAAGCLAGGLASHAGLLIAAIAAMFIVYSAFQGPLWALPPTFFTGRAAAAGIAAANTIAIIGGFAGPYAFGLLRELTGSYQRGFLLLGIPWLAAAGIMVLMRRNALQQALPDPVALAQSAVNL